MLRGADAEAPILKEWKSARAVLAKIRNESAAYFGGRPAQLGKAFVASLKPDRWTDWAHSDDPYTLSHVRCMVTMIPSPGAIVFSGTSAVNIPVGQVSVVGQQDLHSAINIGLCACAWLVVDLRRPDED